MSTTSITVFLETGKTFNVKTEASTALTYIVNAVCKQLSYSDPESYGLKLGNTFLDLSASISDTNLTNGTRLELTKTRRDQSGSIDVVLELDEEKCNTQSFGITTTLWDVLRGFEQTSNGSLNLTKRTGTPPLNAKNILTLHRRLSKKGKTASKVYMMPVTTVRDKEFSSIQALKTTTLEQAGADNGPFVVQIAMRYTNSGIDKFLDEIDSSSPQDLAALSPSPLAQPPQEEMTTTTNDSTATTIAPPAIQRNQSGRKSRTFPSYSPGSQGRLSGIPEILGRVGSVRNRFRRDGHLGGPGKDPSNGEATGDSGMSRQSPVQDMNNAMIEANQEIRQLIEQQTQEAMTDRVKRLSKSSESNQDKERFARSMSTSWIPSIPEHDIVPLVEPQHNPIIIPLPSAAFDQDSPMKTPTLTPTPPPMEQDAQQPKPSSTMQHDELVRMIAHRVSQQLKDAQQRGEASATADLRSLIAQEIVKEQRAGVLPISPADSPST
ncbi:hypothetical protein B0O80DRAFT_471594 [Mortierella sp. GBAus27b]|nr:hypothetical protein B0O80DRAFT_471594 [Mortierella sp. GBAus27b]